jgi:hypothetical protein
MRLLVTSDGLTNEVNDQEIAAILSIHLDREEAAMTLLQTALAHGGSDNITVIVADVLEDETSDAVNLDLAIHGGATAVSLAESILPTVTPFSEGLLPPSTRSRDTAHTPSSGRRVAGAGRVPASSRRPRPSPPGRDRVDPVGASAS